MKENEFECLLYKMEKKYAESSRTLSDLIAISKQMVETLKDDGDEIMVIRDTECCDDEHQVNDTVKLNVGGVYFVTSKRTRDLILPSSNHSGFIDRNPKYFSIILDYVRAIDSTKETFAIPADTDLDVLRAEACYYKLYDLVELIDRKINYVDYADYICRAFESFDIFRFIQQKGQFFKWKYCFIAIHILFTLLAIITHQQQNQVITVCLKPDSIDNISSSNSDSFTQVETTATYTTGTTATPTPPTTIRIKEVESQDITGQSTVVSKSQLNQLLKLCEFRSEFNQLGLIYRASRDGFSSKEFHAKCDGFSPTLTLVKTWPHGYIFGGYTEADWDDHSGYKTDYNAFLVSLVNKYDEPRLLPIKRGYGGGYEMFAVYANASAGPTFGDAFENSVTAYLDEAEFDLHVADQANLNNFSYTKLIDVNYKNGRIPQYEMPFHFQALDIEVYQLLV